MSSYQIITLNPIFQPLLTLQNSIFTEALSGHLHAFQLFSDIFQTMSTTHQASNPSTTCKWASKRNYDRQQKALRQGAKDKEEIKEHTMVRGDGRLCLRSGETLTRRRARRSPSPPLSFITQTLIVSIGRSINRDRRIANNCRWYRVRWPSNWRTYQRASLSFRLMDSVASFHFVVV